MERMRNSPRHVAPRNLLRSLAVMVTAAIAALATIAGRRSEQPAAPTTAPRGASSAIADELVATFSIVAFDPPTGDLGVAVQSKFFAVGGVVPFAAAGVGAIATQAKANTTFGPRGLEMIRHPMRSQEVIDRLLADDPTRNLRQLGIIDAAGNAANFTGDGCLPWAGARSGDNYSVQGNLLAGPAVVDAMAGAFETGAGDLATRMLAALAAGQAAGGDVRGRQSAALLVVREGGGYDGLDDRYIDLRVDDHETPIDELARLLDMRHGTLAAESAARLLQEAAAASGPTRRALLGRARDEAMAATRLDGRAGWSWMTLAEASLALGELDAAAAAGVRALDADPWIKAAVLHDIRGSTELVERLLADDAFRRAWEAIAVR